MNILRAINRLIPAERKKSAELRLLRRKMSHKKTHRAGWALK
jgi:hypothetical protein